MTEIIPIAIVDHSTKKVLGHINLPSFCVMHMKHSSEESNFDMMIKHINKAIAPKQCKSIMINGQSVQGLHADSFDKTEATFEVETESL